MLITSLTLLIASTAVTERRDKSILYSRLTIVMLLTCSLLGLTGLYVDSLNTGIGLYGGLFHSSSITQTFQIFIFIISAVILQLTGFYPRKAYIGEDKGNIKPNYITTSMFYETKIINKLGEQYKIIEYPLIIVFIVAGAAFLVSTSDLVSIFLSIELQSYGLYLLSTVYRNSELATNGGLMYFLLGGLSSCFILLGLGLLYANSGNLSLEGIYVISSLSEISDISTNTSYFDKANYISISFLILSVGFLFKVSAAPFHFWSPDVYDAIPTIVTTFVAIVAKVSIFVFLLELVYYTNNSLFEYKFSWSSVLLISSMLSLIIGTVVGLTQFRIKKLLAYSTISHVGFILLALAINTIESSQAFIFYLTQYTISNLNIFVIIIGVGYSLYFYVNNNSVYKNLQDKNNSPLQLVSQLKGYFYINPLLALSLTITIFSFAGIPPLIGFFAKQMVLSAALDSGFVFLSLICILTSVIGAVYYLNMIKEIFFFKPEYYINPDIVDQKLYGFIVKKNVIIEKLTFNTQNIVLSGSLTFTISVLTSIISLFIFIPKQWLSMANILALILFNT